MTYQYPVPYKQCCGTQSWKTMMIIFYYCSVQSNLKQKEDPLHGQIAKQENWITRSHIIHEVTSCGPAKHNKQSVLYWTGYSNLSNVDKVILGWTILSSQVRCKEIANTAIDSNIKQIVVCLFIIGKCMHLRQDGAGKLMQQITSGLAMFQINP